MILLQDTANVTYNKNISRNNPLKIMETKTEYSHPYKVEFVKNMPKISELLQAKGRWGTGLFSQ